MPNAAPILDRRFTAFILDFDGVIVESTEVKTEAFRTLFADRPNQIGAILDLHRRHAGVDRLTKFEMIYRDILREPLDASTTRALADRFAHLVEDAVVARPMVPGAADLLAALADRLPTAVVSATPQAELDRIVDRRGLRRFCRIVRGSPPGKTETVRGLLAAEGWDPAQVLLVGDAEADLEAAQSNGVAFVGRLTPDDPYEFPPETATVRDLIPLAEAVKWKFAEYGFG